MSHPIRPTIPGLTTDNAPTGAASSNTAAQARRPRLHAREAVAQAHQDGVSAMPPRGATADIVLADAHPELSAPDASAGTDLVAPETHHGMYPALEVYPAGPAAAQISHGRTDVPPTARRSARPPADGPAVSSLFHQLQATSEQTAEVLTHFDRLRRSAVAQSGRGDERHDTEQFILGVAA